MDIFILNEISISSDVIIPFITQTIDIFAITIILVSVTQSILPTISFIIKSFIPLMVKKNKLEEKEKENQKDNINTKSKLKYNNFIKGLLLALEFESANAILKMGVFTFYATTNISNQSYESNINNFIFFVAILSTRIAINQTIRKYGLIKNT